MHFAFDAIAEVIVRRLGTLVKRLLGRQPSEPGAVEIWIGASIVAACLVLTFAVLR